MTRFFRGLAAPAALAAAALLSACQPAAGPGSAPAGMVSYAEPSEHAFTIAVPQGWAVNGGVHRTTAYQATTWVVATSPDGGTQIMIGDPSVPQFVLPSAQAPAGTTVQNAAGTSLSEPYESASQFAADYAGHAFAACAPLQPQRGQAEPALAQATHDQAAQMAVQVGSAAPQSAYEGASATYTCQLGGAQYAVGVIDVVDGLEYPGGFGFWAAPVLISYRTPIANQAAVDQIARNMKATMQPNTQWQQQMITATRQQLAVIQQNGQAAMAALRVMSAQESQALAAQAANDAAALNQQHDATMAQLNAQGEAQSAAWGAQMYNRETNQQSELRYINDQTCIQWADAAQTRCAVTAPN